MYACRYVGRCFQSLSSESITIQDLEILWRYALRNTGQGGAKIVPIEEIIALVIETLGSAYGVGGRSPNFGLLTITSADRHTSHFTLPFQKRLKNLDQGCRINHEKIRTMSRDIILLCLPSKSESLAQSIMYHVAVQEKVSSAIPPP